MSGIHVPFRSKLVYKSTKLRWKFKANSKKEGEMTLKRYQIVIKHG